MLTDKEYVALQIIEKYESSCGISPKRFAELMWPKSENWDKSYNVGKKCSVKGLTMGLVGGSFLSKLKTKSLVGIYEEYLPKKKILSYNERENRIK